MESAKQPLASTSYATVHLLPWFFHTCKTIECLVFSSFLSMTYRRTSKLPAYVERVPLARRRKPDSWLMVGTEIGMALLAAWAAIFVYYRSYELPYYATKFYAHLGSSVSQFSLLSYRM